MRTSLRIPRSSALLLLLVTLPGSGLRAQPAPSDPSLQAAGFSGTVTLVDGTPARGASVRAAAVGGAVARTARADDAGHYELAGLPPGEYTLTFEYSGMATQQRTAETVAGQQVEVNASLELASASETIVVTANRREQDLLEVPMSVSALSQTTIDRMGIQTVGDVARAVPGMEIIEQGPGQNRIFLRGVTNPNSLTSLVGVYVDEIPVTTSSVTQLDLRLVDLERVEVLRGPQGTLYGQGSAGGTVRYITQDPLLDSIQGNVSLGTYTTDHGDVSEELTGAINVPLLDDALGIRLSGTLGNYGGWVDQPEAGREDINDQSLRNLNLKALWKPGERFTLRSTALVHRNDGDGIPVGADENYDVTYPNSDPLARQSFDNDYEIYNVTANYAFDGAELMSSTSSVHSDAAYAGIAFRLAPAEIFITDAIDTESVSQEVRLSSRGDGRVTWVVGSFYSDTTLDRDLVLSQYVSGTFLGDVELIGGEDSESWSVYGDASYAVTDRLELGAGIRYFRDRRSTPAGDQTLRETFDSVDPRLYLALHVTDAINVYANVAKGFRSGGFGGDFEGTAFDPEKVRSYEVGAKGASRRLRWELAGYYGEYEDYLAFVLQTDVFGFLTNAGDAEISGLEALLAYSPTRRLTLQLSGNVTDAELVSVKPGATSNLAGDRLDFVTDYTVALAAEYGFDWTSSMPGFFRVDYSQIGPSTFTERTLGIIEAPSDTIRLLGARLGLAQDRYSAELFGQNLLGENQLQDPAWVLGWDSRPRPRALGVKLGYQF
ncbi:MAG: TonB-dependent receptor [Thermoanaerobaculia bacterium]